MCTLIWIYRHAGRTLHDIVMSIDLEGDTYTIVGVMPGDFYYSAASAQIWIPLATNGSPDRRVIGIGRLRTGEEVV